MEASLVGSHYVYNFEVDLAVELKQACNILNELLADLTMAVTVLKDYEERGNINGLQRQVLHRLCFSTIFIECTKYVEFCTKYSRILNLEIPQLNSLRNKYQEDIKSKGIVSLRNDYIGHIHSKKLQRPLTDDEIQEQFISIIGSDSVLPFLDWICPDHLSKTDKTKSLVGTIEIIRDELEKKL